MFGRLGWTEILVIVVLLFILFWHNKIPGMMKNLANGVNVFKRELKKDSKGADKKKSGAKKKEVPEEVEEKKVVSARAKGKKKPAGKKSKK